MRKALHSHFFAMDLGGLDVQKPNIMLSLTQTTAQFQCINQSRTIEFELSILFLAHHL
jgi:hypothetical protein